MDAPIVSKSSENSEMLKYALPTRISVVRIFGSLYQYSGYVLRYQKTDRRVASMLSATTVCS